MVRRSLLPLAAGCAAVAFVLFRAYRALSPVPAEAQAAPAVVVEWPAAGTATGFPWSVLTPGTERGGAGAGEIARRFRLAGTFFSYGPEQEPRRRAVIDRMADHVQFIVGEGESADTLEALSVYYDHAVVREGGRTETLWLRFTDSIGGTGATGTTAAAGSDGRSALDTSRFGRRIAEDQWAFSRQKVLEYYQELLDNPERLVKVFDSLKPVYGADRKIGGYRLGVEGEKEFFQAAGLREGDVVRRVNGMDMTNRRRAEYFINEFVKDRVNVFAIEIDRGGTRQKLLYEVR